jgi:hypothetical protein
LTDAWEGRLPVSALSTYRRSKIADTSALVLPAHSDNNRADATLKRELPVSKKKKMLGFIDSFGEFCCVYNGARNEVRCAAQIHSLTSKRQCDRQRCTAGRICIDVTVNILPFKYKSSFDQEFLQWGNF